MKFTSEVSLKIRTAIKVKLAELGNDVYEELPDYIMVMVANKKSEEQMTEDLALFLGENTEQFTSWLHSLLSKLQSVASVSVVKPTAAAATDDDDAKPLSQNFDGDDSYATPGSDEASTSQDQNLDGRNADISEIGLNVDSSSATNITLLDNGDDDECDRETVKRKSHQPETKVIRVKVRRVDRNSSRKKNSLTIPRERQQIEDESDDENSRIGKAENENKDVEKNEKQTEPLSGTLEVKQSGSDVSSSPVQKEVEPEDPKVEESFSGNSEEAEDNATENVQLVAKD